MTNFDIDIDTGEMIISHVKLGSNEMTEELFLKSPLYDFLYKNGEIKKITPHHYIIDDLNWKGDYFELTIRPSCLENVPFMLYFVRKNGPYYKSLNDWNKRTDLEMLNDEVKNMTEWLNNNLIFPSPSYPIENGKRWDLSWGRITTSFETRSFNCGIYITFIIEGVII